MKNTIYYILFAVAIAFLICVFAVKKEGYSYHFGFPTWGAVDNTLTGYGINPFMPGPRYTGRYFPGPPGSYFPGHYHPIPGAYGGRPYYATSILPYLTDRCYTSSRSDDCVPGYKSIKVGGRDDRRLNMTGERSEKGQFKCCRRFY